MAELDLHKNTISEFHNNLMVYYNLCKEKQKEHQGSWIKKIDQIAIPEFNIPIENYEDRTILRNKNWGTKAKWRDYMFSQGYNQ